MRIKGEVWSYRKLWMTAGDFRLYWKGMEKAVMATPLGYVIVWHWTGEGASGPSVRFEVIHGGREYVLKRVGTFSEKGLKTMAHRFIKDVQEGIHG